MPRVMSAKDKAFQKEKQRLMKQAETYRQLVITRDSQLYEKDKKPQIKMSTWITKEAIIKSRLLPYFGNRKMNEIKATDIIKWQNEMLSLENGKNGKYAQTYLKSCQAQLSCIFNIFYSARVGQSK